LSIARLDSDSKRLYFILRERKNLVVEEIYEFRAAMCNVDLVNDKKITCMDKTDILFEIEEPAAVIADYSVGINIAQGVHQKASTDIIFACGDKVKAGSISYETGKFIDLTGDIKIYGISGADKQAPITSFWIDQKIYMNWESIDTPGFIRVLNEKTLTTMNISREQTSAFGEEPGFFSIRRNHYDSSSVVAVYLSTDKIYTKELNKPMIMFKYPDAIPEPFEIFAEARSKLVAKVYGVDEPVFSDDVLFKILTDYNAKPSFGNYTQDSFAWVGGKSHIPAYHSDLLGNALLFKESIIEGQDAQLNRMLKKNKKGENAPLDVNVRYAGKTGIELAPDLKSFFEKQQVLELKGSSNEFFFGVIDSAPTSELSQSKNKDLIVAMCETNSTLNDISCGLSTVLSHPTYSADRMIDVMTYKRWAIALYNTANATGENNEQLSMLSVYDLYSIVPSKPRDADVDKDFEFGVAAHFEQGDNIVIFLTAKTTTDETSHLYYIELNTVIIENPQFEITVNKVNVPQIDTLCPTQMEAIPNSDRNYFRFVVDSKCAEANDKDLDRTLYQFAFYMNDPSQAFIEKTYTLNTNLQPEFCVSQDYIHIIDATVGAGDIHKLYSVPIDPRDSTNLENDLSVYNISTLDNIVCTPNKGSVHVFGTRKGQKGQDEKFLLNYNGFDLTNPQKRMHSLLEVPAGLNSMTSMYKFNTDEVILLGFQIENPPVKVDPVAYYVALSGPHITIDGSVIQEPGTIKYQLQFETQGNTKIGGQKLYEIEFVKTDPEGKMALIDPKKRMDLTQTKGEQGGSLTFEEWFKFTGPIRSLKYVPGWVKEEDNKNLVSQRLTKLEDEQNYWTDLKSQYDGFTIAGNFIMVWGKDGLQMMQGGLASNGLVPCGPTIEALAIDAEIFSIPQEKGEPITYGFATFRGENMELKVAVWFKDSKGAWQNSQAEIGEDYLIKTRFASVPSENDPSVYNLVMISANNQGVPRLVYNRLVINDGQLEVSQYDKDVTTFDFPIIDMDATVMKSSVIVTAFIHATKGTYSEGVSFDPTFDTMFKFGGEYTNILNDDGSQASFKGHKSDHFGSFIDCVVGEPGSFFQSPTLSCTYTTPGVFTYRVRLEVDIDSARQGTGPLISPTGSYWELSYYNPTGFMPLATHKKGQYTAVLSKKHPSFPGPQLKDDPTPLTSEFLVVVYSESQVSQKISELETAFAFVTPYDINVNPEDFNKVSAVIDMNQGKYSLVINMGKDGAGKVPQIVVHTLDQLKFNIKDYKTISTSEDMFKIESFSASQKPIKVESLMYSDLDPANGGNDPVEPTGSNTVYIIIIILLIIVSAGIIGYLIYQKQNNEKKFQEDFEKEAEEIGASGDDKADTLLTKSEFSRM